MTDPNQMVLPLWSRVRKSSVLHNPEFGEDIELEPLPINDFPDGVVLSSFESLTYLQIKKEVERIGRANKVPIYVTDETRWFESIDFTPWEGNFGLVVIINPTQTYVIGITRSARIFFKLTEKNLRLPKYLSNALNLSSFNLEIEGTIIYPSDSSQYPERRISAFQNSRYKKLHSDQRVFWLPVPNEAPTEIILEISRSNFQSLVDGVKYN